MAKLDYERKRTSRPSSGDVQITEFVVPLTLLILGMLLLGITPLLTSGVKSAGIVITAGVVLAAVQTILGIAAAYITAAVMGTGFGELRSAILKFAGIIVLCSALGSLIPFGGLLVFVLYFGLLVWLFGLETYEALVFAIIFGIVRFIVVLLLLAALL